MFQVGDPVYDLLRKCPARVTKILQRNVERSVQPYDYEILENDDHTYLVQDNDIREPSLQDYIVQLPDGEAAIFVHDDSRNIIYELEATSMAFIDFEGMDECSYFWFLNDHRDSRIWKAYKDTYHIHTIPYIYAEHFRIKV